MSEETATPCTQFDLYLESVLDLSREDAGYQSDEKPTEGAVTPAAPHGAL